MERPPSNNPTATPKSAIAARLLMAGYAGKSGVYEKSEALEAPDYAAKPRPAVSRIKGLRPERGIIRLSACAALCRYRHNAAERTLRGIALGRKSWLFAGSDRGGERAAVMYTLIGTAKLNDVDPQAWLADILDRIAELPQTRLYELLPWHWKVQRQQALAA